MWYIVIEKQDQVTSACGFDLVFHGPFPGHEHATRWASNRFSTTNYIIRPLHRVEY